MKGKRMRQGIYTRFKEQQTKSGDSLRLSNSDSGNFQFRVLYGFSPLLLLLAKYAASNRHRQCSCLIRTKKAAFYQ